MGQQSGGKGEKWPGFPERLREAFQQAGYWKHDRPDLMGFALQAGFHVGYLYKYVGGDAVPDRERLVALATALGVRPSWLLFGDEESRPKARRRQGRRTAGSLVLALMGTAAAMLGWPSGSVVGGSRPLPVVQVPVMIVPYPTWPGNFFRWLVRPLLSLTQCPA